MTYATALVTGANGFLGRALIDQLRGSGCAVTALVRRAADLPPSVRAVHADIRDGEAVRAALADGRFDVVFHLAAAGVSPDDRDPGSMFATNAMATGSLVEATVRAGARSFVYAGSCAEYETAEVGQPITEDHALTRSNLYGASKVAGGIWGMALARQARLPFCWLRLFGAYGPGEAPHRLIPYLAQRLAGDEHVDLTPGMQVRDLTCVDDVARALVQAGELALQGHEGPFNVCSGHGVAVGDVAGMVADLMRKPRDLLGFGARPYRPDESLWLVGDPSRFRNLTGFAPRVALQEGIRITLQRLGYER